MPPKIVVITGPTATGKTRLGVLLAKELGGEIVSADSMQIYRRMDIGTAKPTPEEMQGVPHHLIDVAEPSESWSAAKFVDAAAAACRDILSRGKLPIVVGGTGLYIDSLVQGRSFGAVDESGETRRELEERYDEIGGAAMLRELAQLDPERAAKLHARDKKRVVRAYEVYLLTGKTITELDAESRLKPPDFDAAYIILGWASREEMYAHIDARVDEMVRQGLFEEVEALLAGGLSPGSTAMQAIGYKEAAAALRGECSRAEAIETIKRETRRYAKRQLTWLRRREDALRIDWQGEPGFASAVRDSTEYLLRCGI
ncbi:MAG: tRNA (adenosine(37)-N6)-dimethylallyltransferase MiaA [Candidatus Scatomorpha sp.]